MEDILPKSFEPKQIEDKWSAFWKEQQYFHADPKSPKPPFCMVLPPPNVTGVLHMGHALVGTLQDVLSRWKRMLGFEVLWVPGTDHAGIATQTVVERNLLATTGKRRVDFSREEFLQHVWKWKHSSETSILQQLNKLGVSCDFSRLAFTLDAPRCKAVRTLFKKLFSQGLIYRGDYLVNWDPVTQTALADDEVEYEEQKTFLWHFRYPLADKTSFISIATTRPETLLGDTAVAVNPSDERYRSLVGKQVCLPIMNRLIPIIADRHVDPSFGSGAVKVTPAHDPNDYEMGLTHNLPFLNIMTTEGKIQETIGAPFAGLSMQKARELVVETMQKLGLVEKIEPYIHRVGVSYRSKAIIEPLLSKQWFVKMSAFKGELRRVVESKEVRLIPESWANTYFHWIDNLRDWCISRQLWWGHRIPIWYEKNNPENILCYDGEGLPPEVENHPDDFVQEQDVLDTWFSSALWPFSVLGWPEKTEELAKFYPNTTLVTGHDILFFWVARMILMGTVALDKPPFAETFLHGLIYGKSYWRTTTEGARTYILGQERLQYDLGQPLPSDVDYKWEKMSKSKGNVIDPLEIIDAFGTDAIRMALCSSATQARQIDLDRRKFEEFKNFANKVWNGARFVLMHIEDLSPDSLAKGIDFSIARIEDLWILSLLDSTITSTNEHLQSYAFDKAATTAYDFFWKEFCAYYVEICKPCLNNKESQPLLRENKQKIVTIVLSALLRLLHPMTPFITEELFSFLHQKLGKAQADDSADYYTKECIKALQAPACAISCYPQKTSTKTDSSTIERVFSQIDEAVRLIRNIRAEMQIPPAQKIDIFLSGKEKDPLLLALQNHKHILEALIKIQTLQFSTQPKVLTQAAETRLETILIQIPLPIELQEKEKARLEKEHIKIKGQLTSLEEKLAQPEFLQKAPKEILEKLTQQKKEASLQLDAIRMKLQSFSA